MIVQITETDVLNELPSRLRRAVRPAVIDEEPAQVPSDRHDSQAVGTSDSLIEIPRSKFFDRNLSIEVVVSAGTYPSTFGLPRPVSSPKYSATYHLRMLAFRKSK